MIKIMVILISMLLEFIYSPTPGKDVDIILRNSGMNFVGTIRYPKDISKPVPAVLLLPGFSDERNELPIYGTTVVDDGNRMEGFYARFARKLADAGYISLRIDYRYSGTSDGLFEDITIDSQLSDVNVAIDYLKHNKYVSKVIVCGSSLGGALAASANNNVDAKILWSPAPSLDVITSVIPEKSIEEAMVIGITTFVAPWGETTTLKKPFFESLNSIDPIESIKDFKNPLLCVCGTKDVLVYPQPMQTQKFIDAHEGVEKLIVLDADHTFDSFISPEKIDVAINESIKWLDQIL